MNKVAIVFLIVILLAICISILIVPEVRRAIGLALTGTLEVGGVAPQVRALYMEYTDSVYSRQLTSTITGAPSFDGEEDKNKTLRLNATVYDQNGDCQNGFTWYVCTNDTGLSTCNSVTAIYTITVASPIKQYACEGCPNCCCNYTSTYNLEYYRFCGVSRVNGTARDISLLTNSTLGFWKFNERYSMLYPYVGDPNTNPGAVGDVISLGGVNVGQWNWGGQNTTKNGANTKFNMYWNASNFTGGNPPDVIPIINTTMIGEPTNSTYAVDDDTIRASGAGYIHPVNTTKTLYPSYQIKRCGKFDCGVDEDQAAPNYAKFSLWWHLYIESGKSSGLYNNSIWVTYVPVVCGA